MKLKVIDSLMGTGKSTYLFNMMYEQRDKRFIYITPYLNEIDRLIYEDKENNIHSKWFKYRRFRQPIRNKDNKTTNLKNLINDNYNIATTHALFSMITPEIIELLQTRSYTLVMDECLGTFELFEMYIKDFDKLGSSIEIMDKRVYWLEETYDGDKFQDIKNKCETGIVQTIKERKNKHSLVWSLFPDIFKVFEEIYVATYLYESSILHYYFQTHNAEYEKFYIEEGKLCSGIPTYKKNFDINIYEGHYNNVGNNKTSLSATWFLNKDNNHTADIQELKSHLYGYLHNEQQVRGNECIWTAFKTTMQKICPSGYKKSFVSSNLRASNEYKDRYVLAYCINKFMNPDIVYYFKQHKLSIDQDLYALGELLQFIWRGSVRDGKEMNVYIPSKRMRTMLKEWLSNKNI